MAVRLMCDDTILVTAGSNTVRLWNVIDGDPIREVPVPDTGGIVDMVLVDGGSQAVVACVGSLTSVDLGSGLVMKSVNAHDNWFIFGLGATGLSDCVACAERLR